MTNDDKVFFKVVERGSDRYWEGYTELTYEEMIESLIEGHDLEAWGESIENDP